MSCHLLEFYPTRASLMAKFSIHQNWEMGWNLSNSWEYLYNLDFISPVKTHVGRMYEFGQCEAHS